MSTKNDTSSGNKNDSGSDRNVGRDRADAGTPRPFANVGPRSIDGVEASDLPDHGRGPVETNPGKELRRKLSQSTGAIEPTAEVGLRGEPEIADADQHGHGNLL